MPYAVGVRKPGTYPYTTPRDTRPRKVSPPPVAAPRYYLRVVPRLGLAYIPAA
jgi:hypothetical protein